MQVENKTCYKTEDLKRLIRVCCDHEGIYVEKVYISHFSRVRGYTVYRGNFFFLKIPKPGSPNFCWLTVSAIICHELAHTTRTTHGEMASHLKFGPGWERNFEWANNGILFMDEIAKLDKKFQPKLLRVLESGVVSRSFGKKESTIHPEDHTRIPINVRFIAVTNRNLQDMVKANKFEEDLYYRLDRLRIIVPPLHRRREDIPILVDHFAKQRRPQKTFFFLL